MKQAIKSFVMGLGTLFCIGNGVAWAIEEPKVEITSFVSAGTRTRAAELCGKVTGIADEWLAVRVVVDPKMDRPGVYNVLVGKEGKFCVAVVTYSGRAEASVGFGAEREAEAAVLVPAASR